MNNELNTNDSGNLMQQENQSQEPPVADQTPLMETTQQTSQEVCVAAEEAVTAVTEEPAPLAQEEPAEPVQTEQPIQQAPAQPIQSDPALQPITSQAPVQQPIAAPFVNTYTPPIQPPQMPVYPNTPMYSSGQQPVYQQPIMRPTVNTPIYMPAVPPTPPLPDNAVAEQHKKSSKRGFRILCIILAAVIVLSVGGTIGFLAGGLLTDPAPQNNNSAVAGPDGDIDINVQHGSSPDGATLSVAQVNEKVAPSVVVINVYSESNPSNYGYSSGVVFSQDGYIITNDHVFESISDPIIYITTYDEKTYRASFVAGDSRWDIAVLKIDATNLTAATFGYSSELIVGQQVVAIGNASGMAFTVSSGIVSALDRRVSDSNGYSSKYIQTTAPISGGSSGGALANMDGQIVGITCGKLVGDTIEGICFAIPSDKVLSMVSDLLKNGRITTRGKLGITYQEINQATADLNNLQVGLQIYSVSEESSLYKKLRQGDIITKVNGKTISSGAIMLDAIESGKPGDTLALTVVREQNEIQVIATILADPGSSNYQKEDPQQKPLYPDLDE